MDSKIEYLKKLIRDVPDFPKPGIIFKDIVPVLNDEKAFALTVDLMASRYQAKDIDQIVAIEARGFIFGAPLAYKLNKPLNIARKPGKLPYNTKKIEYDLEYGHDAIEIHSDSIKPGSKVLIIDDLLATGGTAKATVDLVRQFDAKVIECCFVIELDFLKGREKLGSVPVHSFLNY